MRAICYKAKLHCRGYIHKLSFPTESEQTLHSLVVIRIHIVGEIDKELGKTAFGSSIIAKYRRERCVSQGFG